MTDEMLSVSALNVDIVSSKGDRTPILKDVSFAVNRGETLGVVGESGSGKTMLLRSIMDILPLGAERSWERISFAGTDVTASFGSTRLPVSMVFQDPLTSFNPLRRIGHHLDEVVTRFQRVRGAEARRRTVDALAQVGVPDAERVATQYPHELSGGLRQRAMIAMALLSHPEVLVADEPTTALDATIQAQILALLSRLRAERGLTTVIVTHDLGVVAALCDRLLVMKDGRIVETGNVDRVFADPQHPYTQELLAALPAPAPELDPQAWGLDAPQGEEPK